MNRNEKKQRAEKYLKQVATGEVPAHKWINEAVQRHTDHMTIKLHIGGQTHEITSVSPFIIAEKNENMPMTHLPPDICLRLRDAGLPQPKPAFGQIWFDFEGGKFQDVLIVTGVDDLEVSFYGQKLGESSALLDDLHTVLYCPDAEYLLDHLPTGYVIQKYKGHHHFGDQYTVSHLAHPFVVDAAPTAARASADVYLAMNEPAPLP